VAYRTIANLIEASRIAENTLKVVEASRTFRAPSPIRRSTCAATSSAANGNASNGLARFWSAPRSPSKRCGPCRSDSGSDAADRVARRADRRGARTVRHPDRNPPPERRRSDHPKHRRGGRARRRFTASSFSRRASGRGGWAARAPHRAIQAQLGSQRHHRRRRDAVQRWPARPSDPARAAGNQERRQAEEVVRFTRRTTL